MRYTVVLIPDDEGIYVAYVPSLPGCVTQGRTVEEAISRAQEAAGLVIEHFIETGQELPEEHGIAVFGAVEVPMLVPA